MKRIPDVKLGADPAVFLDQVIRIPASLVKQLPGQPRTFFDAQQIARLRESIQEIGQQQPATVVPWNDNTFRLRDGERRWRCCQELGIPLLALVVEPRDPEEEFELSAAANMNRENHSPLEKALAMKRLRDGRLKRSVAEIARTFGMTTANIYSYLSVVDDLPQEILDLMDPSKQGGRPRTLQLTAAVRLVALKAHPSEQMRLARQIVSQNMTLGQASRAIDDFADEKKINAGRGRERKPGDELANMLTAIRALDGRMGTFAKRNEADIGNLFANVTNERYEEVLRAIRHAAATLTNISGKVSSVSERVGSERGARHPNRQRGATLVQGGTLA